MREFYLHVLLPSPFNDCAVCSPPTLAPSRFYAMNDARCIVSHAINQPIPLCIAPQWFMHWENCCWHGFHQIVLAGLSVERQHRYCAVLHAAGIGWSVEHKSIAQPKQHTEARQWRRNWLLPELERDRKGKFHNPCFQPSISPSSVTVSTREAVLKATISLWKTWSQCMEWFKQFWDAERCVDHKTECLTLHIPAWNQVAWNVLTKLSCVHDHDTTCSETVHKAKALRLILQSSPSRCRSAGTTETNFEPWSASVGHGFRHVLRSCLRSVVRWQHPSTSA